MAQTDYSGTQYAAFRVDVWESGVNYAANTSTVRMIAYLVIDSGGKALTYNGSASTSAGGSWSTTYFYSNGGTYAIMDNSVTVSHNTNGTGSYGWSGTSSVSGWGTANLSGTLTLTTIDRKPTIPTLTNALRTVNGSSFSATATGSVNNSGPAVTWTLQRADNPEFTTNLVNASSTTTSGSTLSSPSLTTTKTYYFRIEASNDAGTEYSSTITSYGVPESPTGLTVTPSTTDASKLSLSWAAPTNTQGGITGYDIFVNDVFVQNAASSPSTIIKSTAGGAALIPGTSYNFRVAAKNATNTSTTDINNLSSSVTSAVAGTSPGPPTAPTFGTNPPSKTGRNVTVTVSADANGINESTPITGYFVQYQTSTTSGGTYGAWSTPQAMSLSGGNYTYTYNLLAPALWYKFRVYSKNSVVNNSAGVATYYPDINSSYTANFSPSASGTTTLFVSSGGKRWNGSTWVPTEIAKRWSGSSWVDITIAKRWNGSAWVDLT